MAEKPKETVVVLRAEVSETFRTRLKTQAVRLGMTMGQLIEESLEERLKQLELEGLEKAKNR